MIPIVISHYEYPEHVQRLIDSINNVGYDAQIVVVDDYSSKPFIVKNENVTLLTKEQHLGHGHSISLAAKFLKESDFFITLDHDIFVKDIKMFHCLFEPISKSQDVFASGSFQKPPKLDSVFIHASAAIWNNKMIRDYCLSFNEFILNGTVINPGYAACAVAKNYGEKIVPIDRQHEFYEYFTHARVNTYTNKDYLYGKNYVK